MNSNAWSVSIWFLLHQGADAKILDLSQRGGVTLTDLFNLDDLNADDERVLLEAKRDPS
jgi:hypothetical protein